MKLLSPPPKLLERFENKIYAMGYLLFWHLGIGPENSLLNTFFEPWAHLAVGPKSQLLSMNYEAWEVRQNLPKTVREFVREGLSFLGVLPCRRYERQDRPGERVFLVRL